VKRVEHVDEFAGVRIEHRLSGARIGVAPKTMAALLPSIEQDFESLRALGTSTGAATASDLADSAGGGEEGAARLGFALRSSASTILAHSPSR